MCPALWRQSALPACRLLKDLSPRPLASLPNSETGGPPARRLPSSDV